jgi:hypothetical protein
VGFSLLNAATPVTVTNSATQLYTASTSNYTRDVVVSNAGPGVIYLGGSVMATTATQYLALPVNESILLGGQSESIFAVTASGTSVAYVGTATNVLVT